MRGQQPAGQVFLSHAWADEAEADAVEAALRAAGVTVVRDRDIATSAPVTEETLRALESATLLVAFYSRRYPTRHSCQWALTCAFLAARVLGDPSDRVLLVNPEVDERHIAPAGLADAACVTWTSKVDAGLVVDRVVTALAAAGDRPFGPLPDASRGEWLMRPRRFVGRYREMWDVHNALQETRAAVVTGPDGMGKTALAEQYGFLFRDAYPGGLVWTDLAGVGRRTPAERVHSTVCEVAEDRFGLDLYGLEPTQARAALAERLTATGIDVLWVVDDVPPDVSAAELNALVVPSPRVHTMLTARAVPPEWPVRQVAVGGLTDVESEELFRAAWGRLHQDERRAIGRLVRRCRGHPLLLVPAAPGLLNEAFDQVIPRSDHEDPVVAGLVDAVRARGEHAQAVLGFAALLAHVPFGGDLLVHGMSKSLGVRAPTLVAQALDELERHGLLRRVDRGHGTRQVWQRHALVATAVHRCLDAPFLGQLVVRAAKILRDALTAAPSWGDLCPHALAVASDESVPFDTRLELLRLVASRYEDRGDLPAARDCRYEVMRSAGPSWRADDALNAARLAVASGDTAVALRHVGAVVERSRAERDVRAEYRARLLAAIAHDLRGEYLVADSEFYTHDLIRAEGMAPAWMPKDERTLLSLATARAFRLRGDVRSAAASLDETLLEIRLAGSAGGHHGVWPLAMVEHARLLLLSGAVAEARQVALDVVTVFADAGLPRHHLAREAVTVHVEGELVLALSELRAQPRKWELAIGRVERVLAESREWHGEDDPLTLELAVLCGQALHSGAQPDRARTELTATEERIADSLGPEHPLALRARQWTGLATMGLHEWEAAARVFENLLPRQEMALGCSHPDSQLTRFQLGVCLAMLGRRHELLRARRLIGEAMRSLRDQHGPWHQWPAMAATRVMVSRLPPFVWRAFRWYDDHAGRRCS